MIASLMIGAAISPAGAQDQRPAPQPPAQPVTEPATPPDSPAAPAPPASPAGSTKTPPRSVAAAQPEVPAVPAPAPAHANGTNHNGEGNMIVLSMENVPVTETIKLIVQITGKIVMPLGTGDAGTLKTKKITVMTEQKVTQQQALDLLFQAFRLNGVGVIETEDVIILYDLLTMPNPKPPPVLGANENVLARQDLGTMVVKLFRLEYAAADSVLETIDSKRPDYASAVADVNTNQLLVSADIDFCQFVQKLINELDVRGGNVKWKTFKLRHADADAIMSNILDLFENSGQTTGGVRTAQSGAAQRAAEARAQGQGRGAARAPAGGDSTPGPAIELRVTTIVSQNSITVRGDAATVDQIADLIEKYWDMEISPKVTKVYDLKYTDPIKIRDVLQALLEEGGGGGGGTPRAGAQGGARQGTARPTGGGAGGGGADQAVKGIFRIEAYPDSNRLIVISKTAESFDYLDTLVARIDIPLQPNIPLVVPLKHADAGDVAELLNALLAEAGSRASIKTRESGLTGGGIESSPLSSSTGSQGGTTGGTTGAQTAQQGGTDAGRLELPWQTGRPREDVAPESQLIGRVRIVPVYRQNAVAILAPPEIRDAVRDMIIDFFDRPGRQVMVSCIVAEVELTDDLALGLRISSDAISATHGDNSVRGTVGFKGTSNDVLTGLFNTSTLDVGVDLNVLIQALAEKTHVRILQEPRVFTADNEEAAFFDGQDVPFITDSQTTDVGSLNQSFQYIPVGVTLNARPRITEQHDVDMEINLILSSVVPGQTLFGGFILDRRQTSTRVIIKNGQTIVISGILKDTESQITRGLPLLSDIPVFGELFKSRENSKTRTELVAFITPVVVDNPDENDANYNLGYRQRLHELAKPLKEQLKHLDDETGVLRERIVPGDVSGMRAPEEGPAPEPVAPPPDKP